MTRTHLRQRAADVPLSTAMRRRAARGFLFALVLLNSFWLNAAIADQLTISAKPLDFAPFGVNINAGELQFIGGVELTSPHKGFGGISGVLVYNKGKSLIAVTDRARWITADVTYDKDRITGLTNARTGLLKNRNGKKFSTSRLRDAEAVDLYGSKVSDGIIVGFERDTRIERYTLTKKGLTGASKLYLVPKGLERGRNNKELESVARFKSGPHKGKFIGISEANFDKNGNIIGYLWRGQRKNQEPFAIKRQNNFQITDIALLENGDFVILERKLGAFRIPSMAIRHFKASEVGAGKTAKGRVLMSAAAPAYAVDNMEGLSVHTDAQGRAVFTIVSDNNFNTSLQRTLLLQFVWQK